MSNRQTWTIDGSHSTVEFSVRHMMVARVKGQFEKVEGTIIADPNDLTTAEIKATIDASSINTRESARDDHLRSADFFDVENHKDITFESTSIEAKGDDKYLVKGNLTMRGTTLPIELDTELEGFIEKDMGGQSRVGLSATGKVSRKEFGLNWNVALEAGGFVVSDEVRIEIHAEATLDE